MKLPPERPGVALSIRQRELAFSFFPMKRTERRWGIHSMLYASEPWAVVSGSLTDQIPAESDRRAAQSFVRQAREYFTAAERADTIESRPLLYYYSFLNLAKALALARGRPGLVGKVVHGIGQVVRTGFTPATSEVVMWRSGKDVSALDELHCALTGTQVPARNVPVRELIAQSVAAHRLWCEAANRRERFLAVEHIRLRHDPKGKSIWAVLQLRADTMRARGRGLNETLREAALAPAFHSVITSVDNGIEYRNFEQTNPVVYGARAADEVMNVVQIVRPLLWQSVTLADPYRRYYTYLSPTGEIRVPEWLSIYAILFWLGSMSRYQPVELLDLLDGAYGAFFREFLATQPSQLLYMLTSEFKSQDVARPAVV
jgi:hypothetical protein